MKLIIIRHGETEWNLQNRAIGQLDSPLTPKESGKPMPLPIAYGVFHSPLYTAVTWVVLLKQPISLLQSVERKLFLTQNYENGIWESFKD